MSEPAELASRQPCVMISSTFYDLRQVRDDLRRFIETELGYRALLSEHNSFPIDPDATTIENCRRRVEHDADILVLIIGRRYGSVDKRTATSVTNLEYLTARLKRIPVFAFVEPGIVSLLPVWQKNPEADFAGEVDTPKLFEFVERVRSADSVWMQEFRDATEIIDALRIQLAYQQQRGLRLQRQLMDAGTRDWFSTLRGEALRIALDRPRGWEYLLFATALTDSVGQHRHLRRRHRLRLPSGLGEDVPEPLSWVQARFSDAARFAVVLADLINGALQEGLGPPGEPGDAETLSFVADAVGELYRDALVWASRLRAANVDVEFRPLLLAVSDMLDHIIEEVEAYGPRVKQTFEEALAAPSTGVPREVDVTLKLTMPEAALQRYYEQLELLRNSPRWGAPSDDENST